MKELTYKSNPAHLLADFADRAYERRGQEMPDWLYEAMAEWAAFCAQEIPAEADIPIDRADVQVHYRLPLTISPSDIELPEDAT